MDPSRLYDNSIKFTSLVHSYVAQRNVYAKLEKQRVNSRRCMQSNAKRTNKLFVCDTFEGITTTLGHMCHT